VVINAALRRHPWAAGDRVRILEETLRPGAVASEVARRHELKPRQLFPWTLKQIGLESENVCSSDVMA
jgi:transposase